MCIKLIRVTIACATHLDGLGEIAHFTPKKKKRNTIFLSKFTLEIQSSSNFKIYKGRNWSTY